MSAAFRSATEVVCTNNSATARPKSKKPARISFDHAGGQDGHGRLFRTRLISKRNNDVSAAEGERKAKQSPSDWPPLGDCFVPLKRSSNDKINMPGPYRSHAEVSAERIDRWLPCRRTAGAWQRSRPCSAGDRPALWRVEAYPPNWVVFDPRPKFRLRAPPS